MTKPIPLSRFHAILWGVWLALGAVGGYFLTAYFLFAVGDRVAGLVTFGAVFLSFGGLEAWGVAMAAPGGTLTETVRAFYRGGWSRIFLVVAFTAFLATWFVAMIPGFEWLFRWAGFVLGSGLFSWLLVHFVRTKGDWG